MNKGRYAHVFIVWRSELQWQVFVCGGQSDRSCVEGGGLWVVIFFKVKEDDKVLE